MYKNAWFWMIIMIVEQFYSMKNKVFNSFAAEILFKRIATNKAKLSNRNRK